MSLILCIETATEICSVALAENRQCRAVSEISEGNQHATALTTLITELLDQEGLKLDQLNAVAVSMGPGSYTGLRVGVSSAKGLCYALGIPLIAINTLESLAAHFSATQKPESGLLIPMLDARRMEVYCAAFTSGLEPTLPTQAKIIDADAFADQLNTGICYFFGNGAAKCKPIITSPNARFVDAVSCSAKGLVRLAQQKFEANQFEDVAYFEPYYLKDFVSTTPKRKA